MVKGKYRLSVDRCADGAVVSYEEAVEAIGGLDIDPGSTSPVHTMWERLVDGHLILIEKVGPNYDNPDVQSLIDMYTERIASLVSEECNSNCHWGHNCGTYCWVAMALVAYRRDAAMWNAIKNSDPIGHIPQLKNTALRGDDIPDAAVEEGAAWRCNRCGSKYWESRDYCSYCEWESAVNDE